MALETLKNIKKLGGFDVVHMDFLRDEHPEMFREDGSMKYELFEKNIRPFKYIYVRHDKNSLSFNIQNGPIKENGINGCQVDTLIHAARHIISTLNEAFPCEENHTAIKHLSSAIEALDARKRNREKRGVEGTNKI